MDTTTHVTPGLLQIKAATRGRDSGSQAVCDAAKGRLLSQNGDPFVYADWERVLFIHYLVAPEVLRPIIPPGCELDTFEGKACFSVVALTMRRFRSARFGSPACLLRPISQQRFLNLRAYVRHGDERGAFFIWGWLSRPGGLRFPSRLFRLTYDFASIQYQHDFEQGSLRGEVRDNSGRLFAYHASLNTGSAFNECPARSLAEFTMEQYSGFFSRRSDARVFRAWHPPWQQTCVEVRIEQDSLITSRFSWFKQAKLAGANFAPGFQQVWLGRAHRLKTAKNFPASRHITSSFYEMP